MTKDQRLEIELLVEDCERAALNLADCQRIKQQCDAKLKTYLRSVEQETGKKS